TSRRGLIEMADKGTLFLDEIAELPDLSQAKLLKFLDAQRFRRLGGEREIEVGVRVIAATNRDVDAFVKAGKFREDLYHRLSVFVLHVPALSERAEEIADLAQVFVDQCARRMRKPAVGLSSEALAKLSQYDFPGNVRELKNIIERAVILSSDSRISPDDIVLPPRSRTSALTNVFFGVPLPADGAPPPVDQVERAYVQRVLEHMNGRRGAAAEVLGISYPTFLRRLRELGIDRDN